MPLRKYTSLSGANLLSSGSEVSFISSGLYPTGIHLAFNLRSEVLNVLQAMTSCSTKSVTDHDVLFHRTCYRPAMTWCSAERVTDHDVLFHRTCYRPWRPVPQNVLQTMTSCSAECVTYHDVLSRRTCYRPWRRVPSVRRSGSGSLYAVFCRRGSQHHRLLRGLLRRQVSAAETRHDCHPRLRLRGHGTLGSHYLQVRLEGIGKERGPSFWRWSIRGLAAADVIGWRWSRRGLRVVSTELWADVWLDDVSAWASYDARFFLNGFRMNGRIRLLTSFI